MGCLSSIYTCLKIIHKMFFPFFAQEINIVKDILVKLAVARLAGPHVVTGWHPGRRDN